MKRFNAFDLYQLGAAVQELTVLTPQTTMQNAIWPLFGARNQLEPLLSNQLLPFAYCRPACVDLVESINRAIELAPLPEEGGEQAKSWDTPISYRASVINNAAKVFEHTLAAELQQQNTYFVLPKSIYDISKLIEQAENLFSDDVRAFLPEKARRDINEAGRCIAFELATAAGFHILRAVESIILIYMEATGAKPVKDSQRNWGQYVLKLREAGADEKVVSALDQIRDLHRNPTLHPDVYLTSDEALALLGVAQSAILAMVADMQRRDGEILASGDAYSISPVSWPFLA
jgi:hypothetical protein